MCYNNLKSKKFVKWINGNCNYSFVRNIYLEVRNALQSVPWVILALLGFVFLALQSYEVFAGVEIMWHCSGYAILAFYILYSHLDWFSKL